MSEKFRDSVWDRHGIVEKIVGSTKIPKFAKVQQIFEDNTLKDIPSAVAKEFAKPEIAARIKPGMSIAITVGSRGLANLKILVKETVAQIKKLGGKPFIFPAMGSHGGATAEGQRQVLESYGVTEDFIGAPIKSSMETVVIGKVPDGRSVHMDKYASEADGVVLLARVKPHTAFRGVYESGLMKMMAIGVAKQQGAESCHSQGFGEMAKNVIDFGTVYLQKAKILFGVAVIENAFDDTCRIETVLKEDILKREPELLKEARALMPQIMLPKFDVLVIDQIGKNFSGDGADPNVSGSYCTPYATGGPEYERYVVLDLSDETHGNAIGIGIADISTKRAYDKVDFDAGYPNALTSTVLDGVHIPMILKNDETAIKTAIFSSVHADKNNPKIVRIKNTSHIEEIMISEALMAEAEKNSKIKVLEQPKPLDFDGDGNLAVGGH